MSISASLGAGQWSPSFPAAQRFLEHWIALRQDRAQARSPIVGSVWAEIAHLARGGKGTRSGLVHLSATALRPDGTAPTGLMHTAAACEMLHLALLIHDDIIDRDLVRRGRPTAAASLSGTDSGLTHDGLSLALVAGDLALSSAVAIVGEAPVADHEARALTALLVHALEESAEGEALDIAYSARDESLTRKQVALAASLKTAAYSFELPLSAGAILAGAAEETIAEIRVLSRDLGLLYQMTDDHVGVFGTESSTGKSSSSDLREGRLTLLLVEALATQEGPALRELLSREPLTSQDIAQARDIIAACGAEQGHRDAIAEQAETCRERLSHSTLPARLTERLGAFAHTISRRGDTA